MTQKTRNMPAVNVHSAAPSRSTVPPPGPGDSAPPGSVVPGAPVRTAAELPDRRYFRIGEVAVLLGVKPYVLRYWETEFPQVRPQKSRSGQRLYRRREVEVLLDIRALLYDRGFTIAGARKALRELEDIRAQATGGDLPPLPRPTEPPPAGTAMQSALGSLPPLHAVSTVPPPMTGSSAPTMISTAAPTASHAPSAHVRSALPSGPIIDVPLPALPPPLPSTPPPPASAAPAPRAEQLSLLHLQQLDTRLLEDLRDGLRDVLALCRD